MVKPNYSTKSIMYPQMMCNLIRKRKKKAFQHNVNWFMFKIYLLCFYF